MVAATNTEMTNPLLHGEVTAINAFYDVPPDQRPPPEECLFIATHEPCCLCLSALAWGGFKTWCTLFDYTDSKESFGIPYDIEILQALFQVGPPSSASVADASALPTARPLYNRKNKMFEGVLLKNEISELGDTELRDRVQHLHRVYDQLSDTYQRSKGALLLP